MSTAHLELTDVRMGYRAGGRRRKDFQLAVDGFSASIAPGEFVSVIGPSGCGKSSLLKVIAKVASLESGSISVHGKPLSQWDHTGTLSFMFQQPLLLPWRTAVDNVALPLQVLRRGNAAQREERAKELLGRVGLADALDKRPHQLSGGMRQRVAMARALVSEPELLLMDEPFGAVDEITRESLQQELLTLWSGAKTTVILITHQIEEAVLLSDKVIVMSARPGRVLRTVEVNLPRPRTPQVRRSAEFHALTDELRSLLHPEDAADDEVQEVAR